MKSLYFLKAGREQSDKAILNFCRLGHLRIFFKEQF